MKILQVGPHFLTNQEVYGIISQEVPDLHRRTERLDQNFTQRDDREGLRRHLDSATRRLELATLRISGQAVAHLPRKVLPRTWHEILGRSRQAFTLAAPQWRNSSLALRTCPSRTMRYFSTPVECQSLKKSWQVDQLDAHRADVPARGLSSLKILKNIEEASSRGLSDPFRAFQSL